ncbi:putative Fungal specific transcription factor [Taphrina deformans PYCC 5710]|uniref:Fungal specific transcription factor n=1 Tax=Taphrina deformans (strain PYCC 5710 / ATCC 11124 / CBS 356.35 / IMI 108563 / JCM 9778 / NBRC 8474) TaxID=1097556 RepID=R4XE57_TAPDE|nr:putative Fungal specific transcription factor [Taphrina deformans PYCC 5710]|eukprot:CCG82725.1 putative Fungal specific transcription factor [Taphrina deformans PYCC 5710]
MEDESETGKRKRRDKYVRKACAECKRRKIKCDGDLPCMHCQTVGVHCEYFQGKARGGARRAGHSSESVDEYGDDVLARLQAVEERLDQFAGRRLVPENEVGTNAYMMSPATSTMFQGSLTPRLATNGQSKLNGSVHNNTDDSYRPSKRLSLGSAPGQVPLDAPSVFYGQSSSVGNFSNMRNQLDSLVPSSGMKPMDKSSSSTPLRTRVVTLPLPSVESAVKESVLPNKSETFSILHIMFDNLISMYPLLHPPTFYNRYEPLWDKNGIYRPEVASSDAFTRSEMGLLFACMAACAKTADQNQQGYTQDSLNETQRWYVAAKALVFDQRLEIMTDLQSIQAMVMLSLYYLQEENEDAAYKLIGFAIRAAYEMGLHLASRERGLPPDQIEFRRRTWWCLYVVDRRTSIQLGRPFGIQDCDSDVQYPTPLDDLHDFPQQLDVPIRLEQSKIPYLMQFVGFSSICGEMYAKIYGVKCPWPPDERLVMDLDGKLEQWRFALPAFLRFDQANIDSIPPWLAKQQLFLHLRGAHVRLLLLRPFVSEPEAIARSHPVMAESALRLSSDIIHTISNVKRTSDLVERLWYPSKQIILTCLGIIFWVVLNFPTKFSASSSKVDLRVALQLLKEFSEQSASPQGRSSLRDIQFLLHLCNQALRSRNQTLIESAAQSPLHEPSYPVLANTEPYYDNQGDLSFLAMQDLTQDNLLLNLLDSGDAALLPTSEQFLMMGEDYSRQTMLSL